MTAATPLMRQYERIKQEHPDAILLFHLGDFYEMFFDDAREAARILNIALTSRDRSKADPVPLCGIPVHSAESYITRLLKAGRKVAVCDQVEDPALAKGIVRREVTRVITPGTVLDERMLEGRDTNYLVAVAPGKSRTGLAALDFSTGEFLLHEVPVADRRELEDRLEGFAPAEVLLPPATTPDLEAALARTLPDVAVTRPDDPAAFEPHAARRLLLEHFGTASLEGFGCQGYLEGVTAAGALLRYLRATQRRPLGNITRIGPWRAGGRMALDAATQRNLELLANLEDGRRERSLLGVLDATCTPLGARRLRAWIVAPLMDPAAIRARLDAVERLFGHPELRHRVRAALAGILDLERLASRIALNTAGPRDAAALRASLRLLPELFSALTDDPAPLLRELATADVLADLRAEADRVLAEDPPLRLKEGGVIREGASAELDALRRRSRDAQGELAALERRERDRTGIATLKVGFTRVFGYYFEVTRPNLASVPADYVRRQTLVNAERFHSAALAAFEEGILGAEERALELEERLFEELRACLAAAVPRLQSTAAAVAAIDALAAFAEVARRRDYRRPEVDEGLVLEISAGRHPVVECAGGERFVPNDCRLAADDCQLMVLTGPNMAGKSTFLRQTALIALMAQIGSFVPAAAARVGVVDRIFTRIGAADRLSRGQSTFMVEMTETAAILHHATERSLVVLDEVGRGTSTFDGLAIAWAVAESLHGNAPRGPRTLFATHYHQLTDLPLTLPRARNFTVAVREWEQQIVFLRTIVPGGADRSYGIHVAQLAGLPASTLARAREILANLESEELTLEGLPRIAGHPPPGPPGAPAAARSLPGARARRPAQPARARPGPPHAARGAAADRRLESHGGHAGARERRVRPLLACAALAAAAALAANAAGAAARTRSEASHGGASVPAAAVLFENAERSFSALKADARSQRQRQNFLRVLDAYRSVFETHPATRQAELSLLRAGALYTLLYRWTGQEGDLNRAQNYYQRLIQSYPKSSLVDDARLAIAYLYLDHFKDPPQAWLRFRDVVALSPDGDSVAEAKRQLRRLSRYAQPDPPRAAEVPDPACPNPIPTTAAAQTPAAPAPPAAPGAATAAAGQPSPRLNRVSEIRHWSNPEYTRVVVTLERETNFYSNLLEDRSGAGKPPRLYLDLFATRVEGRFCRPIEVNDGILLGIRAGQFTPETVRIVLDIDRLRTYRAFPMHNPFRVVIDVTGGEPPPVAAAGAAVLADTAPALHEPSPPPPVVPVTAQARAKATAIAAATPIAAEGVPILRPLPPLTAEGETPPDADRAARPSGAAADAPPPVAPAPASSAEGADSDRKPSPATPAPGTTAHRPPPAADTGGTSAPALARAPAPPAAAGKLSLARQLGLGIRRVVIDPGHGAHDPGAPGVAGLQEKDVALDVALRLREILASSGYETVLTREEDVYLPLEERTALANTSRGDLFVSVHCNASDAGNLSGIETYYLNLTSSRRAMATAARENSMALANMSDLQDLLKEIYTSKMDESSRFAEAVQRSLHATLRRKYPDVKDLGVKQAPFYVLIGAQMPSILAEISFINHKKEGRRLADPAYRELVAEALAEGIRRYARSVKTAGAAAPKRAAP